MSNYVNSMIWAQSFEYIYSHRSDVSIERYKMIAKEYEMTPVLEEQQFLVKGYSARDASGFSRREQ